MQTLFKLQPESPPLDLDHGTLQRALPLGMKIEERGDGTYLAVESAVPESQDAQCAVDRELDRIFFLTSVRVRAEMCGGTVTRCLSLRNRVHGRLPQTIQPQVWTPELGLQLRLWSVAVDTDDPAVKIILFFQIIELTFPDTNDVAQYPIYKDASCPPDPRTEAKLLRHLVAHAGAPTASQTEKYLEFLGLGCMLSDRSNPEFLRAIRKKVPHVETLARQVIESVL